MIIKDSEMYTVKRLFDIPYHQQKNYPNSGMFVTKTNGEWIPFSTDNFIQKANDLSRGLVGLGVAPGDKIGLISSNRTEWNLLDIAIQQVGGIVVPVYPNISTSDYTHIFNDAGIKVAFIGTIPLFEKIKGIESSFNHSTQLFCLDDHLGIPFYESIISLGEHVTLSTINELKANVRNEDLATIIYTSGTTGNPKGVMLSHNNIISNVLACVYSIPADENSKVLSFLPACHIYERMLHYLYMYLGSSIHFAESMDTIGDNIREVKPEIFTAVPRLIEKMYDRIMAKGDEQRGIKRLLFFWAVRLAEEYEVSGKSAWYGFKLRIARKLIFSKWQEALGGNVKAIPSGSAALQPRLARVFMAAGLNILEGYGLSETSPVVSVNCNKRGICIGSVGPLIENVRVKFAEDGEILVKGPNVMMGYYNLPEKTAEAIDPQGWFHTGDIGVMVDEKFLKITDRKKEIFKTSGGKYIVPQAMENKFKESRFIEQIMVVGEGQKCPGALIVPGFPYLRDWAKLHQIDVETLSNSELVKLPEIIARYQEEIELYNAHYGNWEMIKPFALLNAEFSVETGELTPTLKLKRKIIMEKFQGLVDGFYKD